MSKYDVTIRRLAVLLLPIAWRKPLIEAFLFALTKGIETLNSDFSSWRDEKNYRLSITGQVFSLRKVLNDTFDEKERRITITDADIEASDTAVLIYNRDVDQPLVVSMRGEGEAVIIYMRAASHADGGHTFNVEIPLELYQTIDLEQLKAIVNTYHLPSFGWGVVLT